MQIEFIIGLIIFFLMSIFFYVIILKYLNDIEKNLKIIDYLLNRDHQIVLKRISNMRIMLKSKGIKLEEEFTEVDNMENFSLENMIKEI